MDVKFKDIDRGWKGIKEELKIFDDSHVEVGLLSDAAGYDGSGGVNVAQVATWQEFGTSVIPKRPFMRQAFEKNLSRVDDIIERLRNSIIEGRRNAKAGLEFLGITYQGMVRDEIRNGGFQANAPSTIAKKSGRSGQDKKTGSATPLIDSGHMIAQINYEVKI